VHEALLLTSVFFRSTGITPESYPTLRIRNEKVDNNNFILAGTAIGEFELLRLAIKF
jgi:hypothetical protein